MDSPSLAAVASPSRCVSPSLLPEDLRQSPTNEPTQAPMEVVPEINLPVPSKPVASAEVPEGPSSSTQSGPPSLLSSCAGIDADEEYSKDERMLNEFVKLHPMLSLQASSVSTLQLISSMTEKARIKIPELPVVPKDHDDNFLSEPNESVGERPCVCGSKCIVSMIARIRYGVNNDKGFVCKEFLLPDQQKDFLEGKGLPTTPQKCLVCSRYWLTYLYILSRTDSNFRIPDGTMIQTFTNSLGDTESSELRMAASSMPTHTSPVRCKGGYRPDAMLFVDEQFSQHAAQRESPLSMLSFRPVVRFCSTHYRFVKDSDGKKRVIQVGVGVDENTDGLGFRVPLSSSANSGAAKTARKNSAH